MFSPPTLPPLTQAQPQGHEAVGARISAAALLYHRGDKNAAAEAGAALMARYPTHRRALLTALSLGALTADTDMTKRASRLLQASAAGVCSKTIRQTILFHATSAGDVRDFRTPLPLFRFVLVHFCPALVDDPLSPRRAWFA